uniref:Uncharacterized protein n=1 Tax=viral metagenome TaxID=1070528 RepID=A0A6M3K4H8_9ZZZZ
MKKLHEKTISELQRKYFYATREALERIEKPGKEIYKFKGEGVIALEDLEQWAIAIIKNIYKKAGEKIEFDKKGKFGLKGNILYNSTKWISKFGNEEATFNIGTVEFLLNKFEIKEEDLKRGPI